MERLARYEDQAIVAGGSSESMTHDPQISIPFWQCEGGPELIRLPDSKRSTTTAREQYHSGTAGNNGGLTGSEGQAVRRQFGMGIPLGFGENGHGRDRNCDQKDQYRNHGDTGRLVSSFENRQVTRTRLLVMLDRNVANCLAYE